MPKLHCFSSKFSKIAKL